MSLAMADLPNAQRVKALQGRIGWLCQLGRALAAAYAAWTLWLLVAFWLDPELPGRRFAMFAGMDPVAVTGGVRTMGFVLSLLTWLAVAATCWTAWKLFSAYLRGDIFTAQSAALLRRVTLFGIAAVLIDIAVRPLMVFLITGTAPSYSKATYYYFSPNDLALLILLLGLFGIAHIFKVAAELAAENAEIL